jgi:cell division protein FtsW (lipid II flippase)
MFERNLNDKTINRDWQLTLATAGLIIVGALFIFSASAAGGGSSAAWYRQIYAKQIIFYGFGVMSALTLCAVDYNVLARWSAVVYWTTILGLIGVLVFGVGRYGAKRWIDFGFTNLQPSEFAKIGFILMLADYLSRPVEELRRADVFWKALGLAALPFALIVCEPDLGSSLVLAPVSLVMMPQAGAPNDFIFSVIAEEEGFAGQRRDPDALFGAPFQRDQNRQPGARSPGTTAGRGRGGLLFSHVFINIGMNIRLMPVTGIPLPLLSYGGSSVVCSLIAIGILHNVHIYRKSY